MPLPYFAMKENSNGTRNNLKLWEQPINLIRCEHLTVSLLKSLTTQGNTQSILNYPADKINEKSPLYTLTKEQIFSVIRAYALTFRF